MKKVAALLRSVIILFLTLFTLALVTPAYAAPGPPNPQPCKNPETTFNLTDNYITNDDGKAPDNLRWENDQALIVEGQRGEDVSLPQVTYSFSVDFSKLQSLFANTNSNYLEGEFQNNQHRLENITDLSSQEFTLYHGALGKASPKVLIDEQKKKYVEYVYNKPTLAESNNKYTDINGQGAEKTVYDLVGEFGLPQLPQTDEEKENWNDTWGKYWEKIPTAWSEFYEGELDFRFVMGRNGLENLQKTDECPLRTGDAIKFVLPEFFRTTAIADQLNRLVVAKEAQSFQDHGILQAQASPNNPVSKALRFCADLIKNSATNLKKVVKISLQFADPIKTANAAVDNQSCLKPLSSGQGNEAPYCPLPLEEAQKPGVVCTNKNDPNKLEGDNPNVVCTFTRTFNTNPNEAYVEIDPDSVPEKAGDNAIFDSCEDLGGERYRCKLPLQIFPNFRIPWLAAIWNSTLYSDEKEHLDNQRTGRPGVFGQLTPLALRPPTLSGQELYDFCNEGDNNQTPLCQKLGDIFTQCIAQGKTYGTCLIETLNLAGAAQNAIPQDPKERFIKGVDCGKNSVRDVFLKFTAVQKALGIQTNCNLTASSGGGNMNPINSPDNVPANKDNCGGKYVLNNPLGNFGDPNCDFTIEELTQQLQSIDSSNVDNWLAILAKESGFNPNDYNPGAVDPAGAWGLFQMGRGLNGQYDHGDVVWNLQATNAINYNKIDNNKFCYWEAARELGIAKNCITI